jgi:AcrR family transcriptional regulator
MHYTSKEQVLFEIARAGHLELLAQMSTAVDGVTEPRDRLRCLMHAYVLFHARRATLARVINYELGALSAEHAREIERLRRRIDADVRAVLAGFEGIDPRLAALALESLGIDIARWYRPGGRWSPTSLASSYAEIALRILDR